VGEGRRRNGRLAVLTRVDVSFPSVHRDEFRNESYDSQNGSDALSWSIQAKESAQTVNINK
jgi:hypothetical protein